MRRVFLDYIKAINELHDHPSYYNTLTTNCTTSYLIHTRMNPESPPISWKILLSGYVPDYLYELGRIDTSRPFAELERNVACQQTCSCRGQGSGIFATHKGGLA